MAIIAYPLNGIQYSAEDAQSYLCTRTSGVYSAESHFLLGEITADRRITIGAGLAWMKIAEFGGISFAVTEPVTVSVEGADANIDRTDLIVLQYDGNSQEPEERKKVICKKNSNSVQQSDGIFELALYRIVIPAGSTQIIASQIEDVRATPLCGIMKDGVTGIPVNTLVEEFRAKVQASIDEFNSNAANAIVEFNADGDAAIAEINQEANSELSNIHDSANFLLTTFQTNSNTALSSFASEKNAALEEFDNEATSRFSDFSANSNIKFTEFSQMSQRLESEATQVIEELQETSVEFNQAVEAANGVVTNFTAVVIPDAMAQFETEKQEQFSDFVDEGDATILDFQERGNRALENLDATIEDVASGTDVMLQTAFNQSGKVGQVAFADELGLVVTGGFARKLYTGQENVFTVPFATVQQKEKLLENIRNNRPITIRLFSARQTGESTSMDEWSAVIEFVKGNGGTHASVFDWSAPCFDFRFQYADNVNGSSAAKSAYFTCLFDDFKTAVMPIALSGIGAGGTLTFI